MVLITENGVAGGVLLVKDHQNGTSVNQSRGCNNESFTRSSNSVEPTEDSYYADDEDHHHDDDDDYDDDDIYQEFEELDFSELPDTKSIVSDDSFYPPDDSLSFEKCLSPESPEPLSFFKACCSNNAIIVKIMIRQGVTEEEVREVDKNNRVSLASFSSWMFKSEMCTFYATKLNDNKLLLNMFPKHSHTLSLVRQIESPTPKLKPLAESVLLVGVLKKVSYSVYTFLGKSSYKCLIVLSAY